MLPKEYGSYTSTQINDALRGISKPPKYRIRYAILDRQLRFLRWARGIDEATINYDRLAPIKRSLSAGRVREVSLGFKPFSEVVQATNPLIFLRLAETAGTTATDSSGNGHTGTYIGSPSLNQESLLETDDTDRAVRFDAVDDVVTIAHAAGFNTSTFSVGIRCKLTPNGANQALATRDDLGSNRQWGLWTGTDFTEFYIRISSTTHRARIDATIADNNLYDVFGVYDGSFVRLYLDGFEIMKTAVTGTPDPITLGMRLGQHGSGGSRAKGILDEYNYYNRALSSKEIRDLYQSGSGDFSEIDYYTDLIQPWFGIRMPDGNYAEWPRGVYKSYKFPRSITDPANYRSITANDQSSYLVNDKFTDRWTIAALQNPITGINGVLDILESAGFDVSNLTFDPTSATLPKTIDFEIGDSTLPNKLAAINKILKDYGYADLWFNAFGLPVIQQHTEPYNRTNEDVFSADRNSILSADELDEDLSLEDVYNVVHLTVSSPDRDTILTSTGENKLPSSKVNIYRLGRKPWIEKVEAPNQTTLDAIKNRILTEKTMVHKPIRTRIMSWPFLEHQDRIAIAETNLGGQRDCLIRTYREHLIDGGDWTDIEADIVFNPN